MNTISALIWCHKLRATVTFGEKSVSVHAETETHEMIDGEGANIASAVVDAIKRISRRSSEPGQSGGGC